VDGASPDADRGGQEYLTPVSTLPFAGRVIFFARQRIASALGIAPAQLEL